MYNCAKQKRGKKQQNNESAQKNEMSNKYKKECTKEKVHTINPGN